MVRHTGMTFLTLLGVDGGHSALFHVPTDSCRSSCFLYDTMNSSMGRFRGEQKSAKSVRESERAEMLPAYLDACR